MRLKTRYGRWGFFFVLGAVLALALVRPCSKPEGAAIGAWGSQTPPPAWRGHASVTVHFGDYEWVQRECTARVGRGAPIACAEIGGDEMWVPNPCLRQQGVYDRLLCHELAHINGWPANHPRFD